MICAVFDLSRFLHIIPVYLTGPGIVGATGIVGARKVYRYSRGPLSKKLAPRRTFES